MKLIQPRVIAIGAAVLTLGFGGVAAAQQPPPTPAAGREHRDAHERPSPEAMAAKRAEHLRATLQLRPDQEGALQAFLGAIKPAGDWRQRMGHDREEMAKLTTPERLDRMQAKMDERRAKFAEIATATKRFYAALSPSQQKAFDAMRPMGHGDGMGGRRGGHGGHDGHKGPGMPG